MHMFSHQVAHWLEFVMVLHLLCGHDSCCVYLCIEPKLLSKLSIVHLRKTPLRSAVEIVVWLFNYTQCTEHSALQYLQFLHLLLPSTTLGTKDTMPRPIDKTQTKIKLRAGNRNVKEYEED
ncbi:hypothetical protein GQX74_011608 [Glossina fuscipes]|nr:hypothetical protein GQX74_011608 [Glossina fuscipes]